MCGRARRTYAEAMRFGREQSEALLDPGKADLVAETADGVVELVIVADAPCTGSDGQLSSLQDKVQTYVSFAVDGQMGRSIPEAVGVTGQVKFDSHVVRVLTAAVELVNELTPGRARGMPYPAPTGIDRVRATAEALGNEAVTAAHAAQLADIANRFRVVFEAAHDGDTDRAANETYRLLPDTHACPQLDLTEPGWNLHFHGADDTLADGWAAGCASGLALAIGSDLAGRLRVCAAPAFDRVFVDVARNAQRRFCSPQCQRRVKAAAHRARKAAS